MDRLPKDRGFFDGGPLPQAVEQLSRIGRDDFDAAESGWRDFGQLFQVAGRANGQERAEMQITNAAAPLGLVHVMSRDQQRDALSGKLKEQVPQLAAGH